MGAQGATEPHQLFALSVGMQLANKASVSVHGGGMVPHPIWLMAFRGLSRVAWSLCRSSWTKR